MIPQFHLIHLLRPSVVPTRKKLAFARAMRTEAGLAHKRSNCFTAKEEGSSGFVVFDHGSCVCLARPRRSQQKRAWQPPQTPLACMARFKHRWPQV